jgi:hypothetical protein
MRKSGVFKKVGEHYSYGYPSWSPNYHRDWSF